MLHVAKATYRQAEIMGRPALLTESRLDIFTKPKNLYCYDLSGFRLDSPHAVAPFFVFEQIGTVLLTEPLDLGKDGEMLLEGRFKLYETEITYEEYLTAQGVEPEYPKYQPEPVSDEESGLFYSDEGNDEAYGCIGHVRCDFGHDGNEFWHTWWPHKEELNTPQFKEELEAVIHELRASGVLESFSFMEFYCNQHPEARIFSEYDCIYGFKVETPGYQYYFRCIPRQDDYNVYCYCYDRSQQMTHDLQEEQTEGMKLC